MGLGLLKVVAVGAVGALVTIGLAACFPPSSGFSVLDKAPTSADVLPTNLPDHAVDQFVQESARFVGEYDGDQLWLARGVRGTTCILVYPNATDWGVACGAGDDGKIKGPSYEYLVIADGAPTPPGTTKVSENVYAVTE